MFEFAALPSAIEMKTSLDIQITLPISSQLIWLSLVVTSACKKLIYKYLDKISGKEFNIKQI